MCDTYYYMVEWPSGYRSMGNTLSKMTVNYMDSDTTLTVSDEDLV